MERLTVFTPTFNRAKFLKRGYEALKKQSCKDFIWMIVDDGSTDDTQNVVSKWKEEDCGFKIKYIKKENGGLHTGYNTAIKYANTELMVCVDSDDYMPENAVEMILCFWDKEGTDKYAGIVGLDFDTNNCCIGDLLPNQKNVNLIDLLVGKYHIINGDRTNVVRTELYKQVAPMKTFKGEKSFNPHYMHLQISKKYDFLVLNENLKFVEYQEGGMSDSIWRQYLHSPNSFAETRKLYLSFDKIPVNFKIKNVIHYISSCILAKKPLKEFFAIRYKILVIFLWPMGFLLSYITQKKGE